MGSKAKAPHCTASDTKSTPASAANVGPVMSALYPDTPLTALLAVGGGGGLAALVYAATGPHGLLRELCALVAAYAWRGEVVTVAGGGDKGWTREGPDVPGRASAFNGPYHVAAWRFARSQVVAAPQPGLALAAADASVQWPADGAAGWVVADCSNLRLRFVEAATGVVTTVAGGGARGSPRTGLARAAKLDHPSGVCVDPATGSLVFTDATGVWRVAAGVVSRVAGGKETRGYADGPAPNAQFDCPRGVVCSRDGRTLYTADRYTGRLRRIRLAVAGGGGTADDAVDSVAGSGQSLADAKPERCVAAAAASREPPKAERQFVAACDQSERGLPALQQCLSEPHAVVFASPLSADGTVAGGGVAGGGAADAAEEEHALLVAEQNGVQRVDVRSGAMTLVRLSDPFPFRPEGMVVTPAGWLVVGCSLAHAVYAIHPSALAAPPVASAEPTPTLTAPAKVVAPVVVPNYQRIAGALRVRVSRGQPGAPPAARAWVPEYEDGSDQSKWKDARGNPLFETTPDDHDRDGDDDDHNRTRDGAALTARFTTPYGLAPFPDPRVAAVVVCDWGVHALRCITIPHSIWCGGAAGAV